MARKFSVRRALMKPAVVHDVLEHYFWRLRLPDQKVQLRAARSQIVILQYHIERNLTPKPNVVRRKDR